MAKQGSSQDLVSRVFDLLTPKPGLTYGAITYKLRCTRRQVEEALRQIHQIGMAGKLQFTVAGFPQGLGKPWLFRVVHGRELLDPEVTPYLINRIVDYYTRSRTLYGMVGAAVHDTHPRSTEGKLARLIYNDFDHAVRQTQIIQELLAGRNGTGGPAGATV